MAKAPIGEPVEDSVSKGRQQNARNRLDATVNLLNDAIKAAQAEGLFVLITVTSANGNETGISVEVQDHE